MNYCKRCKAEIENTDFHPTLCRNCWADVWGVLVEKSPMVSPEMIGDFKVGDIVNYHSIIGGPVTSENHRIKKIVIGKTTVVFISNHTGCVAIEAISKATQKVKLDFMVDELEKHAYVEDPVKIIITNPFSIIVKQRLGESGIKLARAKVPFLFTKKLADEFIEMEAAIEYKSVTDLNKKTWGFLDNKEDAKYDK